jgi:hypothetical protein
MRNGHSAQSTATHAERPAVLCFQVDDLDYQVPFKFTGKIDKLTIELEPPVLTPADEKQLLEVERRVRQLVAAGAKDRPVSIGPGLPH